ncbi:hypothetical protein PWT90_10021 [Aphanocladium album]|nr:hypothetical protein PWT90_10021 [Aphanocladium album]
MDSQDASGASPSSGPEASGAAQVDNAIRAIQHKKPIPTIDFSIHTMDDGTQVSTKERFCKGQNAPLSPLLP